MTNAPPIGSFVQQREGKKDCIIASIATVIGQPYEAIVSALGLGSEIPDGGIDINDTIYALFKLGWIAAPLVTTEWERRSGKPPGFHPNNEQTIEIVNGRKAVIAYHDAQADDHAIAWTGSKAIDCSSGVYVNLEDIRIQVALILSPLPAARE
jgi:hypothetical protein